MNKYNKPDLNAPRYRYKAHSILNKDICLVVLVKKRSTVIQM
jgi:hypothetical protein